MGSFAQAEEVPWGAGSGGVRTAALFLSVYSASLVTAGTDPELGIWALPLSNYSPSSQLYCWFLGDCCHLPKARTPFYSPQVREPWLRCCCRGKTPQVKQLRGGRACFSSAFCDLFVSLDGLCFFRVVTPTGVKGHLIMTSCLSNH